ncbi:hypothetical protein K3495_g4922 [Podosphaera aphanis]|nr:hypothetical protein K3495_g4922 [Podosphaera aphanis]
MYDIAKALKVSNALSSLSNTVRGVLAHLLRQVAVACVLPIAYYGSEIWWHMADPVKDLEAGFQIVLTLYSNSALHREAGLPSSEIALDRRTTAATARLRHLDSRYPQLRRANRVTSLNRPTSRFTRHVLDLPQAEQINLIALPPWTPREDREAAYARMGDLRGESKGMATKKPSTLFLPQLPLVILFYIQTAQNNLTASRALVMVTARHSAPS